ncbi:unnamed protein product [Ectocarpus sp. 4 AP-2014]
MAFSMFVVRDSILFVLTQHHNHPGPDNSSVLRQATQVLHPLQTVPNEDASYNHKNGCERIQGQRVVNTWAGRGYPWRKD